MEKQADEEEQRRDVSGGRCSALLLLAGAVTTFGGALPAGYNIGVINAPSPIIKAFCNESVLAQHGVALSGAQLELLWSAVVSIFLVGGMAGSLSGSWLANRAGRKGALVLSLALGAAAAALFCGCRPARSVEMLVAARLVAGLAGGLTTSTVPMHLSELAPLRLRGVMGVLCPLGLTLGVLLAQVLGLQQVLGTERSWHWLLALYALLIGAAAVGLPWLPESPKYLYVVRDRPQEALQVLSRVRGVPAEQLGAEVLELAAAARAARDSGARRGLAAVLRSRQMALPLALTCALQAGQQLSGINAVFYYSVSIFQSAGLSLQVSQLVNLAAGGMNLAMAAAAVPLSAAVGRRTLVLLSCGSAAACLVVLAVAVTHTAQLPGASYVAVVALLAYVFCYQLGLGPVPYFIGSELFETGPRPAAMALGSMANWAANFLVGMSFPSLQLAIGAASFYVFAALTALLLLFVYRYLPETRGRDVAVVAALCSRGLASRPLAEPPAPPADDCSAAAAAARQ